MPRQANVLNVKKHLEWVERSLTYLLDANDGKWPGGVSLPPAYETDLRQIRLLTKAILRKHENLKTRKDIRVETR